MAKVGMEYVVSALLEEGTDGTPTYTEGRYWGPSSTFSLTMTSNDIVDYGDDNAVEADKTLSTLGISVELNESSLELEGKLLGHTYTSSSKTLEVTTEDVAPFVGLGCIGKSRRNNATVYKSIWIYKAQFSEPNDENATKQESTTFNHTTFEGTGFPLSNHKMVKKAEFDTLAAAKSWLNEIAGITTSES